MEKCDLSSRGAKGFLSKTLDRYVIHSISKWSRKLTVHPAPSGQLHGYQILGKKMFFLTIEGCSLLINQQIKKIADLLYDLLRHSLFVKLLSDR